MGSPPILLSGRTDEVSHSFLEAELTEIRAMIENSARISDPRAAASLGLLIGGGGKFLRPKILVLSAMTGKYDGKKIRPLASAVELLHTATLIHDDVIDDSPSRRGLPAVHTRVGQKDAVLAGDFLFSRCFLLAAESTNPENAQGLARAIDIIVSAEIAQDTERWTFSPSVRSCIRKIGGKTAVLFSLAARAGAVEAGASKTIVSALSRAAWAAGVAFQIQDDILDWSGDEKELGKAVMNDLAEGFCTLPLAFALSTHSERLGVLLTSDAVQNGSSVEVADIVKKSGSIDKARVLAETYRDRSMNDLGKIPPSFVREELMILFSSFISRSR